LKGIGPGLGCLIAVAFYKLIKLLEYEMANPGQDADEWNDPTRNPYHGLRERQRIVTNRVLRSLGFDPASTHYQSGDEHMESLGSIHIYHKQPYGSQYLAGSGNAPGFGPLGTPVRRSEDDAYRLIGDKESRQSRG
jgi:aquaporin related protein